MTQVHSFRPHTSFGGTYLEADTFAGIKSALRAHLPSSVTFRAIKVAGDDYHTVLMMSSYNQGPIIAGYYRCHK